MIQIMHSIRGYVTIRVGGYSYERFVNLCGNHNIFLWDIYYDGSYATMNISIKGFLALKNILKKTGTKAVILERHGLPFFIAKCSKKKMFIAGLFMTMLFLVMISGFIWKIEINGNYSITDDVLIDFLQTECIHVGMMKRNLDIENLEKELRETYEEITWTSAKLRGTTLVINIKEETNREGSTPVENTGGYDLVSSVDGIVHSIVTRAGVPMVKKGDSVQKGDILVAGAIPVYNDDTTVREYRFCVSDADIVIQYERQEKIVQNKCYQKKQYTGNEKKWLVFKIYDYEVNLGFGDNPYRQYDINNNSKQMILLDQLECPVYYGQKTIREYELENAEYSDEEMNELLLRKWNKLVTNFDEKGVQIVQKNDTIKKNLSGWIMNLDLVVRESAVELKKTQTKQIDPGSVTMEAGEE